MSCTPTQKGKDIFDDDFIKESEENSDSNQSNIDSDNEDDSEDEGYQCERSLHADASYADLGTNKINNK